MADPFDEFVGIPFREHGRGMDGADCWGLFRLALLKVANLEVPSYDELYSSVLERKVNAELIRGRLGPWFPVPEGAEKRCDGILLRDGRFESHIALVTRPGLMLHIYQGSLSCIDRYRGNSFALRVVGFWRHQSLAEERDLGLN